MIRSVLFAAAALTLAAGPSYAAAPKCRDAHGKFIKCVDKRPMKPVRCKDAHGRFVKCGMPGARPIR